jgi:hypothetical protein
MLPCSCIPAVQILGDVDHPDFREAITLLRCQSRVTASADARPELIVLAQSRPDSIASAQVEPFRRTAPLAGIVTLLGSWCEGETRTGRPLPGIERVYWYQFPAWWQRQLQLLAERRCPDWARPANFGLRISDCGSPSGERGSLRPARGLVVLRTSRRENADSFADVVHRAGYATLWQRQRQNRRPSLTRGTLAGIWDGGQLSEAEADDLSAFCTQMSHDGAPVVALLDFPRRDCVDRAYELGAAAVVGKPWFNTELIATLESVTAQFNPARAA